MNECSTCIIHVHLNEVTLLWPISFMSDCPPVLAWLFCCRICCTSLVSSRFLLNFSVCLSKNCTSCSYLYLYLFRTHLIDTAISLIQIQIILFCMHNFRSATLSHCSTPAAESGFHVLDHPAQHQLYLGWWSHHSPRNRVPSKPCALVWDQWREHAHLQALAPGSRHRVPHKCTAHQTRRRWHWPPRTPSYQQN